MERVDVFAVVGSCTAERQQYAKQLATTSGRTLVSARNLRDSPHAVDDAVFAVRNNRTSGMVIEVPGHTIMTELIGTLAQSGAETRLSEIVCVADAAHLLQDFHRDDYAPHQPLPWHPESANQFIAHAILMAAQLEYASVIVLVNWECLPTPELSTLMALISHLSPIARLRLDNSLVMPARASEPYTTSQDRPGWVRVLNGNHDPYMTDPHVSAFRYENLRAFHPERLQRLLDHRIEPGEFGTVIRSAGFCRFATRPHTVGQWDHVGSMISFDPLASDDALGRGDDTLAFGQDIAFIGLDLDHEALSTALDQAALSDTELAAGPATWAEFADPFPAWPTIANHTD